MINNFWTQGFPASSLADPNNPLLYSIDPHLKTPMMQQWHLGMEYQLPSQRWSSFLMLDLTASGSMASTTAIRLPRVRSECALGGPPALPRGGWHD